MKVVVYNCYFKVNLVIDYKFFINISVSLTLMEQDLKNCSIIESSENKPIFHRLKWTRSSIFKY